MFYKFSNFAYTYQHLRVLTKIKKLSKILRIVFLKVFDQLFNLKKKILFIRKLEGG